MSKIENKIEASDKNINDLLKDKKFFIDYFQREYRWEEKHMVTLVEDLTSAFLKSYDPAHKRSEVANYQSYYLGPVVFSISEDGKNSIIDGQQRITSITLFLIYLNNLQKERESQVQISNLIFSEKYGEKSFNMTDEDRQEVLKALYEKGEFDTNGVEDETSINISERYQDIDAVFPESLLDEALPFFIDWFIGNVVIVKITAYSDENAYTIFETMNDRGMNLTSTEMLKGYVLSRIRDKKRRSEINELWKEKIQQLHEFEANADLTFFQAWFRAKYASSMRPTKAGAENQDFELIGTRFHNWFKDNHEELFDLKSSDDFYDFFKKEFVFMANWYMRNWESMIKLNEKCPHVFYISRWGIAPSLQDALLLATINPGEQEDESYEKINRVARFIETYTVRRAVNYRKFGASAIRYTFFNIIKAVRNQDLENLNGILLEEVNSLDETFSAIPNFSMHQQNKRFVKHLLSRISAFVDQEMGKPTNYVSYHEPTGKKFEIEHLWSNKFEDHKDEFEQEHDFVHWRNSVGALVLLPNGTNQSFSSDKYEDKLGHYLKENTYAQTLHPDFYKKNPNFFNSSKLAQVPFRPHEELKKDDIAERAETVQKLCETIWSPEYYV
ncbi:DUF262 domain-containing protein [Christiangramia portivictoriae]|uniref:DUF262 domain-containing protein n=1 Tax=Christiangramia portivictoriae TaxID=326069 RepID=UPI000426FEDC|nr:DUF262 domain-containing protein [Christiangramia portivictoriae]